MVPVTINLKDGVAIDAKTSECGWPSLSHAEEGKRVRERRG